MPRTLPRWIARTLPAVGVTCALLLIVWAQYEVSRNPVHVPFHWPSLHRFNHWLEHDVYGTRNAVGFGLPLFVVGALAIAALIPRPQSQQFERWASPVAFTRRRSMVMAAAVAPPLLIWSFILLRLAMHHYDPDYRWWMGVVAVWTLAAVVMFDGVPRRVSMPRLTSIHLAEAALVLALAGTFIGINARDLSIWRYSAIGDEGAFWDYAQRILHGQPVNWFSQSGVYGDFPVGSSVWQAAVMRVFGSGLFGWKMASLLAIVLTFPVFYWLVRQLLGTRVAAFATMFLAVSHYLFSYAHTGYDNIFPLFPTTASLAFFVAGLRRRSLTLLFVSGIFAGMGWYTFYSSRAIIIILALTVLFLGWRAIRPEVIGSIGAGFVLAVMPIFATNKYDVIGEMLKRSNSETHQSLLEKISQNTPRTFLAFSFNPNNIHYTAGALMDSASFVLAVVGIAVAVRYIRNDGYRLIVIWWLVAGVITGVLSQYDFVSISRIHYMIPPMAAFAGIGIDRLLATIDRLSEHEMSTRAIGVVALAALAPTLFIINGQHFFDYSAHHSPTTIETVAVREFTAQQCADQPLREVAYWPNADSLLVGLWKFFGRADSMPLQIKFADAGTAYGPYPQSGGTGCVAYAMTNDPVVKTLQERLDRAAAPANVRLATDLSGQNKVTVITPAGAASASGSAMTAPWHTDLSKGSGLDGVVQGQERDFIKPIDDPQFAAPATVHGDPDEPAIVIARNGHVRAYPVHILLRNGPVNDIFDGMPIVVTFDPIAGSARVYERDLDGETLAFGLTGLLRDGNALLYDRATETWWQQLTGAAVTGQLAGSHLTALPAMVDTLAEFSSAFPDGQVMVNDFDETAKLGNPYLGYDAADGKPIFTTARVDGRLKPMTHVAVIDFGSHQIAVPFPQAPGEQDQAYPIDADGHHAVLLFDSRQRSLLDRTSVQDSRHVGTVTAFLTGDGQNAPALSPIGPGAGRFRDSGNGTIWDALGQAVDGPDAGKTLTPLQVTTGFWFAIASQYRGIQIVYP